MKIVFDTNVLISGFIATTGPTSFVLAKAFKKHEVICSDFILMEFREKLVQKLKFPKEEVEKAIYYLKKRISIMSLKNVPKIKFSDKKDIPILELLAFAKPHYFVTGDKKLLSLRRQGKTMFLSPREAMEVF